MQIIQEQHTQHRAHQKRAQALFGDDSSAAAVLSFLTAAAAITLGGYLYAKQKI